MTIPTFELSSDWSIDPMLASHWSLPHNVLKVSQAIQQMCDIYTNISTIQKERNAIRASADKLNQSKCLFQHQQSNVQTHIFLLQYFVFKSREHIVNSIYFQNMIIRTIDLTIFEEMLFHSHVEINAKLLVLCLE